MKKNFIYTIVIMIGILLSGCGSDSKKDPIPVPAPPPGGYVFTNCPSVLEIKDYKTYPIPFQLTKDGLVVPDTPVFMKVPSQEIGSVQEYSITTDENGKGTFIYNPPSTFPESGTLTLVFTDGNITLETPIKLNFDLDPDASKGRATTLSIAYTTSECDETRGIVGHYYVHAVDRFSNLPVVGIPVTFSLINGVKEIHDLKVQEGVGNIHNTDPIQFTDNSVNYAAETRVESGNNLIILPTEDKTNSIYLGGWSIKTVTENLTLAGHYVNLVSDNDLTYIIGNEERLLGGEDGSPGTLANAHVEAVYPETDNQGYAYFDIVYDAVLAGHTVTLEAHGNENGNRIGIAKVASLRMEGDFSAADTVISNNGRTQNIRIPLSINPTCIGQEALIDVPVNPNSFSVEPVSNCAIVGGNFHTDGYGTVTLKVATDGNTTATGGVDECTVKWDGGISSLFYEY